MAGVRLPVGVPTFCLSPLFVPSPAGRGSWGEAPSIMADPDVAVELGEVALEVREGDLTQVDTVARRALVAEVTA